MSKKKKHHYVPKFYLSGFVDPNVSEFLWVYEKGSGKVFKSKPENVALQTHFYSFTTPDGEKDSETIEDALAETESITAPVFEKLRSFEMPNDEERLIFSSFLGLTLTRVPTQREIVESVHADLYRKVAHMLASNPAAFKNSIEKYERETGESIGQDPERLRKFILEDEYDLVVNPEFSLGVVGLGVRFAPLFYKMTWSFFKATDRFKFLTSDNPLSYDDPTHDPKSPRGVGLASKNVEVIFPVSREVAFVGTWRKDLREGFTQANHQFVKEFNRQIVITASRHIFASEKREGTKKLVTKYKDTGIKFKLM